MGFESFRGLFDCWRFWKKKKNKLLLYLKILLFSSKIPSERPPRTQPPFHKLIIGLGSSELMPSCTPKDPNPVYEIDQDLDNAVRHQRRPGEPLGRIPSSHWC
jgi:hypothetical protein